MSKPEGGFAVAVGSACLVRSHLANGLLKEVWKFDSPIARLSGNSLILAVACADGSVWTRHTGAEEVSKRQRVDPPSFSPFPLVRAKSSFVCVCPEGSDTVSCLAVSARGTDILVCSSREARLLDGRVGSQIFSVKCSEVCLVVPLNDGRWLAGFSNQSIGYISSNGVSSEPLPMVPSRLVFLDVCGRDNSVIAVCESGAVMLFGGNGGSESRSVKERNAGFGIRRCSLAGSCLVVLPVDEFAPPVVFDLTDDNFVPRMLSVGTPALAAVHATPSGGGGFIVLGQSAFDSGPSLLVRPVVAVASLAVACGSDRTDSVRDAVQALAAQTSVQESLKSRHAVANARLAELNQAVLVKDKITGTIELGLSEDGSVGLRATIRNLSEFELSTQWSCCMALGNKQVHSIPLLRGVKKGSSTVVIVPNVELDSYTALTVKLWIVHRDFSSAEPQGAFIPSARFIPARNMSMLLHATSLNPLDLCWTPRNPGQARATAVKKPSPSCHLHHVHHTDEQRTTFRMVLNTQHLEGSGLSSTLLDSAFGTSGSIVVRPAGAGGLSEILLSVNTSSPEALSLRAAIARRLAARLSEGTKSKNHDWRNHRNQLLALAQRLEEEDAEANVAQIYEDLRKIGTLLQ